MKVVSFREHLRADQQIDFAPPEIKQSLFKLMASRFSVAIDPTDSQTRKAPAQNFFNLFGPFANVIDVLTGAVGTLRGRALAVIAVVTDQSAVAAMIGQRHVAVRDIRWIRRMNDKG